MPVGRRTTSLLRIVVVVVVVALGLSFVVASAAASIFPPSASAFSTSSCPHPAFLPCPSRFQAVPSTRPHHHHHHHRVPTKRIRHSCIMPPPSSSSCSRPQTLLAAAPQEPTDRSPTPTLPLTTLLPAGGALLALATTIGHLTTEGPVERTLVSTLVICSVLASIAYKDSLPLPSFLRGRGGREGGKKVTAAEDVHVLSPARQLEFNSFQTRFLVIQLMATFIDFIQGPYLYKVYENYGYGMNDIASLYLLGFGSSALSSPFAGVLADTYGRRLGCVAFASLQASSSLLLHQPSFLLLALGRILSGIATSFLATCFEAWMISEHNRRAFPSSLLNNTFPIYVFLMGVVAVGSGAVAGVVEKEGGVLAPFDVCAVVAGGLVVLLPLVWKEENYGGGGRGGGGGGGVGKAEEEDEEDESKGNSSSSSSSGSSSSSTSSSSLPASLPASLSLSSLLPSLLHNKNNHEILWVGLTQAFFEAAMFTWVFLWTPSLESTGEIPDSNLGLVFATLMVGVMCGSSAFRILTTNGGGEGGGGGYSVEVVLLGALLVGGGAMGAAAWPGEVGVEWLLVDFVVFEAAVGVFFAAMGSIRARVIPEGVRATVMNAIRVLLNVLIVLMYVGPVRVEMPMEEKRPLVLGLCSAMVFVASVCHLQVVVRGGGTGGGGGSGEEEEEKENVLEIGGAADKAQ